MCNGPPLYPLVASCCSGRACVYSCVCVSCAALSWNAWRWPSAQSSRPLGLSVGSALLPFPSVLSPVSPALFSSSFFLFLVSVLLSPLCALRCSPSPLYSSPSHSTVLVVSFLLFFVRFPSPCLCLYPWLVRCILCSSVLVRW